MKVNVKFTGETIDGEILRKGESGYIRLSTGDCASYVVVRREHCTPNITEPTEFGYYKLTFDTFAVVAELVRHCGWYLTGYSDQWTWEELLKFLATKPLTSVERIV